MPQRTRDAHAAVVLLQAEAILDLTPGHVRFEDLK